jgi:hypothetical protein
MAAPIFRLNFAFVRVVDFEILRAGSFSENVQRNR